MQRALAVGDLLQPQAALVAALLGRERLAQPPVQQAAVGVLPAARALAAALPVREALSAPPVWRRVVLGRNFPDVESRAALPAGLAALQAQVSRQVQGVQPRPDRVPLMTCCQAWVLLGQATAQHGQPVAAELRRVLPVRVVAAVLVAVAVAEASPVLAHSARPVLVVFRVGRARSCRDAALVALLLHPARWVVVR